MKRLLALLLLIGCASAARLSHRRLTADTKSSTSSDPSSSFDVLHIDTLPRILQDAPVQDGSETAKPGAYGATATAPSQPDLDTIGVTTDPSDPAASDAPSDTAGSGTAGDQDPSTTGDTTSDTVVVNQGTTTRESAPNPTQDSRSIPTTTQESMVAGSGGSSNGNQSAEVSGNQIAGIVVGVAVAVGAVALGALAYQRHKRRRGHDDYVSRYQRYDGIEM